MTDRRSTTPVLGRVEEPWWKRATTKFDVRADGLTRIVLVTRHVDDQGLGHDGMPVPWRDIATFEKWSDAMLVLDRLHQSDEPTPQSEDSPST